PGDGASAAQAATRPNKRLIAPAPRRAVRFAILGMNRHVIIAMPVSYQIGPVAGGGEAQGVNTSLTLLNDPPGVGPPLLTYLRPSTAAEPRPGRAAGTGARRSHELEAGR